MISVRLRHLTLLVAVALLGLTGCEPYMSMTDQVPAQTRRAADLLPSDPRFVGMVDLESAFQQVDELKDLTADSMRASAPGPVRTFLEATGMDPRADLKAVYGTVGSNGKAFSAVVFAELTADQMDRYLEQASEVPVQRTTYRDVPVYQVPFDAMSEDEDAESGTADDASDETSEEADEASPDSLSLAFVDNGTIAVALSAKRVQAMVDRHQDGGASLGEDTAYMTLVKRLGRGRTAWVAGRNVLQTAFGDSTAFGRAVASADSAGTEPDASASDEDASQGDRVAQAGIQRALVQWSNRVLGLTEMPSGMSALEGKAGGKIDKLKRKVREQALAVTLTESALEGEVYLTMSDDASASNVVEMAEGLLAILKLSGDKLSDHQQDLLDQAAVERDGPLVRVQFSLAREYLRQEADEADNATAQRAGAVRWADASIRPVNETTRRSGSIMRPVAR